MMTWPNVDSLIHSDSMDSLIHPDSMFPLYAVQGERALLECSFSQTPRTLLAWWKYNYNFYTHDNGAGTTTPGAGISWDNLEVKNNGQLIILSNVTKATAGWYKCLVTFTDYTAALEDPPRSPIMVDVRAKRLVVVKLPRHPPVIRGSVTDGVLTAMCQAPSSWPPVTLTWYKNNEAVPKFKVSQDSGIISRLTLPLEEEEAEVINLICTATVEVKCEEMVGEERKTRSEEIYWEKASVAVTKREISDISNSLGMGSDYINCVLLCVLVFSYYVVIDAIFV